MKNRVYIETTLPSFYCETRNEPEMVAMQRWTATWWDEQAKKYTLLTSIAVLDELQKGGYPNKEKALSLMAELPILPIEDEIYEIVEAYIEHHLMPKDPGGDALHLALASFHQCHFLLTWNCSHLANANKREHIRHINTLLGLYVPMIATPFELLNEEEEE